MNLPEHFVAEHYLFCKIWALSLGNILLWTKKEVLVTFLVPIADIWKKCLPIDRHFLDLSQNVYIYGPFCSRIFYESYTKRYGLSINRFHIEAEILSFKVLYRTFYYF